MTPSIYDGYVPRTYDSSRRRVLVTMSCAHCGEAFDVPQGQVRRNKRFCSNGCRLAWLNTLPKHNAGKRSPRTEAKGYRRVWDGTRRVMEHRLVMESMIGRPLLPAERVHHLNGTRADNRPENLVLVESHTEHLRRYHTPG